MSTMSLGMGVSLALLGRGKETLGLAVQSRLSRSTYYYLQISRDSNDGLVDALLFSCVSQKSFVRTMSVSLFKKPLELDK
jgi:hypothetical protein